jgi:hypothetical protein
MNDCRLPPGESTIVAPSEISDKHGHKLDGDYDPRGHGGCDHRSTPEWKAEHPKPRIHRPAEPMKIDPQPQEQPMSEHVEQAALAPVTTETIGVDAAVTQVKSLVPGGADASPALLIGGAAVLAVVGAAIKMGPGMLKARAERAEREHELQLKRLEREEQRSEDEHSKCSAARGALELRVGGIEKRLDEVASESKKAVSSVPQFDEDFDPAALEKRLTKLEKAHKAAPKKR